MNTTLPPNRLKPSNYSITYAALIRFRWAAICGQFSVIVVAFFALGVSLPVGWLLGVLFIEAISNLVLIGMQRRTRAMNSSRVLGSVMALDIAFLTVLLGLSGGVVNPFSLLYLVHIALATVTLGSRWAWGLGAFASLASCSLFLLPRPSHHAHLQHHEGHGGVAQIMSLHLPGMWVALVITAFFIVYFVQLIRRQLAEREAQLERVADMQRRQERLAGLATLSAGAAHELSTPLSTIALVAKELERELQKKASSEAGMIEDAQLIRSQVARCQTILQHMASNAGATMGEMPESKNIGDLFEQVLGELTVTDGVEIIGDEDELDASVHVLVQAVSFALQGVVRNAREAAIERGIEVRVELGVVPRGSQHIALRVRDWSGGMDSETHERAAEPFYSTKATGQGMGLGLFLAATLCERLEGQLEIDVRDGEGTDVMLVLPRA